MKPEKREDVEEEEKKYDSIRSVKRHTEEIIAMAAGTTEVEIG